MEEGEDAGDKRQEGEKALRRKGIKALRREV